MNGSAVWYKSLALGALHRRGGRAAWCGCGSGRRYGGPLTFLSQVLDRLGRATSDVRLPHVIVDRLVVLTLGLLPLLAELEARLVVAVVLDLAGAANALPRRPLGGAVL